MAVSVESPAPTHLLKESTGSMGSSPLLTPSSDRRLWSTLRSRVDALLEERRSGQAASAGESDRGNRMKEDSLLLLRGFDSISHSLTQLTDNLENALQGARSLAKPPTLTDIFHCNLETSKGKESDPEKEESHEEESKKGLKRKLDDDGIEGSEGQDENSQRENGHGRPQEGKLKKAKNIAISMATKAASLARELKSLKSDLCFMQERCALLEEENSRLRYGFAEGMRPEEDDLVRLQLEALLAEKSRLANENANLTRENQCLHQLVEYHQLTSQEISATYEQVIQGMCLDFSSPPASIPEEVNRGGDGDSDNDADGEAPETAQAKVFGLSTVLDECYDEQED